jgi:heptosyltransferase-2
MIFYGIMIKTDCVHFPLDRPCRFHKETGVTCLACGKYISVNTLSKKTKILIIKIGAMGDVLRTTFLLEGLKKKYKNSEITWIVAQRSAAILEQNPNVKSTWYFDCGIFEKITKEKFDICINLDLAPESLSLAALAYAQKKIGFWLGPKRKVMCSGAFAKQWLDMSAFDEPKKKNKRTYQYWMSKTIGLPRSDYEIFTPLVPASLAKAKAFQKKNKLSGNIVVGINPGAGGRWKYKKWTDSGYVKLIDKIHSLRAKVLLLGGNDEKELIAKLLKASKGKAISAGTDNSLLDFFALLNLCDIVVTGDTLALHAALGLKKNAVAIFGPTSSAEIEMYSRGTKVVTPAKCACCYLPDCNVSPDCMTLIKPEIVFGAVSKHMKAISNMTV